MEIDDKVKAEICLDSLKYAITQSSSHVYPTSPTTSSSIPRRSNLSYDEFFSEYLVTNQPVIITDLTDNWRCRQLWLDSHGKIDFEKMRQQIGKAKGCVSVCKSQHITDDCKENNDKESSYGEEAKLDMPISQYLSYWQHLSPSDRVLYLKDFHYVRNYPETKAYTLPTIFSEDWLNKWCDSRTDVHDDYRFLYMGFKGTWTSIHADVFRSYSWSTNIVGRKKWVFYPPNMSSFVLGKNRPEEISQEARAIECIQESGETIFVPSSWFHAVYNLEDTISINHNWINASNILFSWNYILYEHSLVVSELLSWDSNG
eukprot:TRINITY_DN1276_c2_g1_i1.p1 TRINITY_DN1276_c2_g1~~TRINITY_DN1276_c2_g1_i1.p1  ORF type:complete len:315 (-),score=47.21 TRINITY_DN1276_c2_g1_i1:70-1014(-)